MIKNIISGINPMNPSNPLVVNTIQKMILDDARSSMLDSAVASTFTTCGL